MTLVALKKSDILNHFIDHEKYVKNIGTSKESQFQVSVLGVLLLLLITLNVTERIGKLRQMTSSHADQLSTMRLNE